MKSGFIVLFIFINLSGITSAQVTDSAIEKMMTKKVLSCSDIYYNAITLIPELYHEGKTDTVDAIVAYTHRNCDMYTATVAYLLLHSIETHTFSETIIDNCKYHNGVTNTDDASGKTYYKHNIIGLLNSYIIDAKKSRNGTQYLGDDYYFPVVNKDYLCFIESMALSLLKRNDLSPVERFIVELYAHPDAARFADLKRSEYKGSLLQKAYTTASGEAGVEYAVFAGRWQPFGKLTKLGDHPMVGGFIGSRENKTSLGITFSVAFNRAPIVYNVKKDGSIFATDRFVQYYIGYDFAQALYSTRRTELTINTGLGYDGIEALVKNDKHGSRTVGSFNWNFGMGVKVFLKHQEKRDGTYHSYIGLQAKYNMINYSNPGGADLTGRSACFVLTFGGFMFDRPVHYESLRTTRRFRCWG